MKIAIITLYDNVNFGNKLQNYATQTYFEQLGYEVETLPYWEEQHPPINIYHLARRTAHELLRLAGIEKRNYIPKSILEARRNCIKTFSDEYLKLGKEVHYRKIDCGLKNKYDYFVTGSDQVWHCMHGEKAELNFFFLRFADEQQRLTMSPSFGFREIPQKYKKIYFIGLKGFKYLSCREEEGAMLINALTNQKASVLLDPTMLVEENVWYNIQKKPQHFIENDYILIYTLGQLSEQLKEEAIKISKKYGCQIVCINDIESDYYISTRPDEFLYWISHAKLVFTDSFHAVVFSILFKKAFILFQREDVNGMENRLDTLLSKFSLANRKYTNESEIILNHELDEEELFNINYSNSDEILQRERIKAANFYSKCMCEANRSKY